MCHVFTQGFASDLVLIIHDLDSDSVSRIGFLIFHTNIILIAFKLTDQKTLYKRQGKGVVGSLSAEHLRDKMMVPVRASNNATEYTSVATHIVFYFKREF